MGRLHSGGLIHGDITTSNILVMEEEEGLHLVLIDFGLRSDHRNSPVDPDPHSDQHQSDKLDPEPDPDQHQFTDDKPKCIDYEPILAVFQGEITLLFVICI